MDNKPRPGTYEYNKEYAKKYRQSQTLYQLRIPPELKNAAKDAASAAGESLNQYILTAVQDRIDAEKAD